MLHDADVHPKIKLAMLWASVMFCYIYADYFGLFVRGQLAAMNRGVITPLGQSTDGNMLFVSAMMALPSMMIFLSVALPARANRALNLLMGVLYTVIISLTMWSGARFFVFYGIIEMALTMLVCFYAIRWPKSGIREVS